MQGTIYKPRFLKVALLKNALMIAFGELGYSIFFGLTESVNPNTELIVKQLNQPTKEIIEDVLILHQEFPNDLLGASVIYEPRDLRSILVVFDLVGEKTHRFGVLLPGPDNYGWKQLYKMRSFVKSQSNINFKSYAFRGSLDLTTKQDSLEYFRIYGLNLTE